jgi:hypothetical protein
MERKFQIEKLEIEQACWTRIRTERSEVRASTEPRICGAPWIALRGLSNSIDFGVGKFRQSVVRFSKAALSLSDPGAFAIFGSDL